VCETSPQTPTIPIHLPQPTTHHLPRTHRKVLQPSSAFSLIFTDERLPATRKNGAHGVHGLGKRCRSARRRRRRRGLPLSGGGRGRSPFWRRTWREGLSCPTAWRRVAPRCLDTAMALCKSPSWLLPLVDDGGQSARPVLARRRWHGASPRPATQWASVWAMLPRTEQLHHGKST